MNVMQVVKTMGSYSCAHRHYAATSHCRYLHGYDRSFTLTIEGSPDPKTGWVIDFGAFKSLDAVLKTQFDHTLVIGKNDPLLEKFQELEDLGGCQLRVMDNPGMEGAALWVLEKAQQVVTEETDGRAKVVGVEAHENSKNSAKVRHIEP